MQLTSLRLENYRGFEALEISLHPSVNVLVGLNGAGKTAALDGLAVALGAWMKGIKQLSNQDRPLHRNDARLSMQESVGYATSQENYPIVITASALIDDASLTWTRELQRKGGRTTTGGAKQIRAHAAATEASIKEDPATDLPLFAYYGTGRLWVQKRSQRQTKLESRFQGYDSCLDVASNTKLFKEWMAWRESVRLQQISLALEKRLDVTSVVSPHLDAVASAATCFIDEAKRFFYSAAHQELRVEFEDGRVLPFDRLSDGQRSLITLGADLAWRAAQLNPHHAKDAAKQIKGVVLIDELELHLHPEWQRTVLHNLTTTFPKLQFIVTTHSPQVLSSANPEWVKVLRHSQPTSGVGPTKGRDSNTILREIMGVLPRPKWMEEKLGRLNMLVDEAKLEQARDLLTEIQKDLGDNDPSVQAMEWELADLEGDLAND